MEVIRDWDLVDKILMVDRMYCDRYEPKVGDDVRLKKANEVYEVKITSVNNNGELEGEVDYIDPPERQRELLYPEGQSMKVPIRAEFKIENIFGLSHVIHDNFAERNDVD